MMSLLLNQHEATVAATLLLYMSCKWFKHWLCQICPTLFRNIPIVKVLQVLPNFVRVSQSLHGLNRTINVTSETNRNFSFNHLSLDGIVPSIQLLLLCLIHPSPHSIMAPTNLYQSTPSLIPLHGFPNFALNCRPGIYKIPIPPPAVAPWHPHRYDRPPGPYLLC